MKRLLVACAALALAGCAAGPEPQSQPKAAAAGGPDNKAALAGMREMKLAFDMTEGSPPALIRKLDAIETTRKQLIAEGVTPRMVVAFRGPASIYTQTDLSRVKESDRAEALQVRAKLRALASSGAVEAIEQCNLPVEQMKIKPADLMPEVKLVGNGWISLGAYQARGYAYIAP